MKVKPYRSGRPGVSLDKLLEVDKFDGEPAWGNADDPKRNRWKRIAATANNRFGKRFLRSVPLLGYAMTAWAVLNFSANPAAAISAELDISEEGAEELLSGNVMITLDHPWRNGDSVQAAQLADGTTIRLGDTLNVATLDGFPVRVVTKLEERRLVGIRTTERAGFVAIDLRRGQEILTIPNIGRVSPRSEVGEPINW